MKKMKMVMNKLTRDVINESEMNNLDLSFASGISLKRLMDIVMLKSTVTMQEAFRIFEVVGVDL